MLRKSMMAVGGAGLVLLVGGCPLFDVQVETQEVCLRYGGLEVPAGDGSGTAHLSFAFDDFKSLQGLDQIHGSVEFVRVALTAKTGISDFGFLTSASASVASGDPQSSLPEQTVVDCSGDGCERDGAVLSVAADSSVDALAYLRSQSILITLDIGGTLPSTAWTVDVDVCLKAKLGYQQQI
jgi:hypothetical protein